MKTILIFISFFYGSALGYLRKRDLRLERVSIVYYDPKYIKDPVTFTSRSQRGGTYKTNCTCTIMQPWGNNVTGILYVKKAETNVEHVLMTKQVCDLLKLKWILSLLKKYTDVPTSCNVPMGEYHILNMELRQRNLPFSLPSGVHYAGLMYALTKTHHVILNINGTIHVT